MRLGERRRPETSDLRLDLDASPAPTLLFNYDTSLHARLPSLSLLPPRFLHLKRTLPPPRLDLLPLPSPANGHTVHGWNTDWAAFEHRL